MPRMPMPELRPGPLRDLMVELHGLHRKAGFPSTRRLALGTQYSHSTIHLLFKSREVPRFPLLLDVVEKLATLAPRVDVDKTLEVFEDLWQAADAKDADYDEPSRSHESYDKEDLRWVKSVRSLPDSCVEVRFEPGRVAVRRSRQPDDILEIPAIEWEAFIEGVKNGEFEFQDSW